MRKLKTIEMNRLTLEEFKEAEKLPLIVVLDDVRSLYNVGSVFRTGDAFRVEAVYLCGITATPPHPEIHKTALGGEESVDWRYFENTEDAVRELHSRGCLVYAIEQVEGSTKLQELINSKFKIQNSKWADAQHIKPSAQQAINPPTNQHTNKPTNQQTNPPTNQQTNPLTNQPTNPPTHQPTAVIFGNEVKGVKQSVVDMCDGCLEIPQFGTKHSLNVSVTAGIVIWEFAKMRLLDR
jgi:rRNA methylases